MNEFLNEPDRERFSSPQGGISGSGMDSETDLLRELIAVQKKSLRASRLALSLCVLALLVLGAVLPSAVGTMRRVDASMKKLDAISQNVESVVGRAEEAMTRIGDVLSAAGDGASLSDSMESLREGMSSFQEVMGKLNSIDFAALNQAVSDLSNAAAPLRQFSGLFGR